MSGPVQHPNEEQLLRFADGELAARERGGERQHGRDLPGGGHIEDPLGAEEGADGDRDRGQHDRVEARPSR